MTSRWPRTPTCSSCGRPTCSGPCSPATSLSPAWRGASVTLRGLGIGGSLIITGAGPLTVRLEHCTVRGGVDWSPTRVVGDSGRRPQPVRGRSRPTATVDVSIEDSAVDAGLGHGSGAVGRSGRGGREHHHHPQHGPRDRQRPDHPAAREQHRDRSGRVDRAPVRVRALQLRARSAGSQTPRRFRCQPDLEIDTEVAAARAVNPGSPPPAEGHPGGSVRHGCCRRSPAVPRAARLPAAGRRRARPDPFRRPGRGRDGRVLRAVLGPPGEPT